MKYFLMKKVNILFYAVVFSCLISCSDETTDSSGMNDPVTTVQPESPPATPPVNKAVTPPVKTAPQAAEKKETVEVKTRDTPRTEISIGQKGGSIRTKKGSDISVDDKGVKIGSKDVLIDIKRDTNQ